MNRTKRIIRQRIYYKRIQQEFKNEWKEPPVSYIKRKRKVYRKKEDINV